jgi:hypothetical protein
MAMVVLILIGAALSILSIHVQLQMKQVDSEKARLQRMTIADAALAETLAGLAASPGFGGIPQREVPGGWVKADIHRRDNSKRLWVEVQTHYRGQDSFTTSQIYMQKADKGLFIPVVRSWRTGER